MNDDNLDLLDLDDNDSVDTLPDVAPFTAPRPKKPWMLLTVGLLVIVLATYIIIRAIGDDSSSATMEVDLDAPVMVVDEAGQPVDMNVMPPVQPVQVVPQPQPQVMPQPVPQPKPQPVVQPQVEQPTAGVPARVIEDRKEVIFDPSRGQQLVVQPQPQPVVQRPQPKPQAQVAPRAAKPVVAPAKTPVSRPAAKATAKPAVKPQAVRPAGGWYVQFGSYSTRALAENAQRQISNAHKNLFAGKQFSILAAQLKNGTTTYRLRVAFNNASDANGFCRNAKSDGLDCYVAK